MSGSYLRQVASCSIVLDGYDMYCHSRCHRARGMPGSQAHAGGDPLADLDRLVETWKDRA